MKQHRNQPNKRGTKHQSARQEAQKPLPSLQNLAKSFFITWGVAVVLLVLFSLSAYFSPNPNILISPLGLLAAAIASLIGGVALARLHGHSSLLCGLCNGIVMSATMLLLSLFFPHLASGYSAWISAILHTAFLFCSVIGAFLGRKRGKKKKHRSA